MAMARRPEHRGPAGLPPLARGRPHGDARCRGSAARTADVPLARAAADPASRRRRSQTSKVCRRHAVIPAPTADPDAAAAADGIEPKMKRGCCAAGSRSTAPSTSTACGRHEAHAALNRFITRALARGDRTILVITGKGLKKLERRCRDDHRARRAALDAADLAERAQSRAAGRRLGRLRPDARRRRRVLRAAAARGGRDDPARRQACGRCARSAA